MKKRGKFHVLKINGLDESRQGLIFYICRCYPDLPPHKRKILDNLYREIGGAHEAALRALMVSDESFAKICLDHYIGSETTLYRLRLRFYTEFPLDEMML
jgi:hypothetical protein